MEGVIWPGGGGGVGGGWREGVGDPGEARCTVNLA